MKVYNIVHKVDAKERVILDPEILERDINIIAIVYRGGIEYVSTIQYIDLSKGYPISSYISYYIEDGADAVVKLKNKIPVQLGGKFL